MGVSVPGRGFQAPPGQDWPGLRSHRHSRYLPAHISFFAGVPGPVPKDMGTSAFPRLRADGPDSANQIISLEPQSPLNEVK